MTTQYLNDHDYQKYGPDVVDLTQRAALDAVSPHLAHLEQQNAALQQRLAVEARRNLDQRVERAVPNFREIDRNPAWHRFLLGVDALSGRVRQQLLNEAISSGSEQRIAAFFRTFQQQAGAQSSPDTARPTPSRSRSAPIGSRVYSHDDIAKIYERRRKGGYTDDTFNKIEADIFRAQHENRISGGPYLTK